MPRFVLLSLALLIGAVLPVQAGVNAQLRQIVGSPFRSALVNFAVGAVALIVVVLFTTSQPSVLRQSTWWMWIGGLLGAMFVSGSVVLAPRLGATALVVAVVTGQLTAAVLIDHFGWIGYQAVPISWTRVLGIMLLFVGLLLIQRR